MGGHLLIITRAELGATHIRARLRALFVRALTMSALASLLARIPADHWGFDLAALLIVALGCAAVLSGVLTPDQLPAAVDTALYGLGLIVPAMAARGAILKARAQAGTQAALAAVAAAKAHDIRAALEAAAATAAAVKETE